MCILTPNIEIKINQVAAKNTPKYDKINGAVDIDGQPVNPSTDGGKTDGAGIAIDMSRYAMIGANPSFSSVTVTHRSNLSGTTNISNGAGGEVLNMTTTNVNANDTNWTETITNKKSTVTTEEDKITTLKESATTRTTVVGTENLTVSGTTTEVHTSNVTITNSANVTTTTNGTTTETKVGNVTENNSANKQENTTGTHKLYTTGDTCINSQANANFYGKGSTNIGVACDGTTKGSATTVYGTTTTISGNTANVTGATTLNLSGNTINERALTANTNVTSAYTSATTATLTGTNLSISETNTTINSCGKIEVTTDKYTLKQCSNTGGTAELEFCNGYTVKSNAINLQQCGTAGTISITAQTQNINGGSLTIRESGATDFSGNTLAATAASNANINVKGNLTEVVTGTTNETHSGAVTINNGAAKTETTTGAVTENNKAGYTVNTTGDTCLQSTADMNVGGAANTNIGTNCDDSVKANYVNIKAKSGITETANTVTISGTTSASISGATVNVSGNTTNISGATNLNMSGKTVNVDATDIDVDASNNYCLSAATKASIYGKTTNIGVECGGTTATTINISGTTINEGGTTNNNNFATINNTATTINNKANFNITGTTYISGNTTISGDTTIGGKLYLKPDCTSITSTTVNAGLCEVLDRSAITIEKNTNPSDPQLATVYTIKQNGVAINTIEVAKDQFLQNAEVVKNTAGEWVIRLTWWIYDPDSGTHTTTTTDVNASELVKDLTAVNPSDNGTALNHNVSVNAWYDSTSGDMKFSAETTPNMHVGNMYVTGTTSASTVSGTNVNGGTISGTTVKGVTISGTNITASAAIRANNVSANTISAASSINTSDLYASSTVSGATVSGTTVKGATVSAGTLTATGNTTLAATTASSVSATSVSSPTINGTNITASAAMRANNVSANTISANTFTGAMSKKLTWTAGAFTADTTGYNGSADKTITIPTSTAHLSKATLTIDYNADVRSKSDTSYNTEAAATVSIPGSLDHLSNYDGTNININHPTKINGNVSVTGTITASGAIYSSDRNLKENIFDISEKEFERVGFVKYKTYNFKGEGNKMYGVIAQDLQDAGLGEMVYSRDDGTLAVDYTSLMILQLARLKRDNENMLNHIAWLERRIEKLEGGNKE